MTRYRMPFGKHKSMPIEEVPEQYLEWLLSLNNLRDPLRTAVSDEVHRREEERYEREHRQQQQHQHTRPAPSPAVRALRDADVKSMAQQIVDRGFRQLALAHHPDRRGGDTQAMQQVNAAVTALRALLEEAA